jgi:hypothetical protein
MRSLAGLVGLLMFLGFGWLFVDSWNEWRAYPAVPTPMTVREAMELDTPGPGAWVTLTNARLPCSEAEQRPSSAVGYRLAFGETREERVIIGDAPPCSDTALTITGVLKTAELGRIVDLEFPGAPFTSWPKRYQSTLWTASGPDDTKLGLFMMPPFALMGLVVLAFYWRPETPPPPIAALDLDGPIDAWAPSMRVLPVRRLSLASGALFDRVLALGGLVVIIWLLGTLAWLCVTLNSGVLAWLGAILFGALAGLMLVGLVRSQLQQRADGSLLATSRHEALVRVIGERNLTGNLALMVEHPVTRVPVERDIAMNAEPALIVNGHCLAVWGSNPDAFVLARSGFAPFELTNSEQVQAMRRLRSRAATVTRA